MYNLSKKIVLVLTVIVNMSLVSMAADITSGQVLNTVGGNYGADLANVTGASVSSNGTDAYIQNTQTNSVLNWNNLNVAPTQSLNFSLQAGQTSLNNVIGTAPSVFAGKLESTGAGRVIISNGNGMIFENGSYTNVNSLILTTRNVTVDGTNIDFSSTKSNSYIQIGTGVDSSNLVKMNIAGDLNIITDNLDINNAEIITNNINLVTTDGVTYVASKNAENEVVMSGATLKNANCYMDYSNMQDNGNVNIANSTLKVAKDASGKVYIVARGDINVKNSKLDGTVGIIAAEKQVLSNVNVTTDKVSDDTTVSRVGIDGNPAGFTAEQLAASEGQVYETKRVVVENIKTTGDLYSGRGDITFTNSNITGKAAVWAKKINGADDCGALALGKKTNDGIINDYSQLSIRKTTYVTDHRSSILDSLNANIRPENQIAAVDQLGDSRYGYDDARKKYGEEIDTIMRRQFSPRGFAASDDEIQSRKNAVISSARKGKNANSIILTRSFNGDTED